WSLSRRIPFATLKILWSYWNPRSGGASCLRPHNRPSFRLKQLGAIKVKWSRWYFREMQKVSGTVSDRATEDTSTESRSGRAFATGVFREHPTHGGLAVEFSCVDARDVWRVLCAQQHAELGAAEDHRLRARGVHPPHARDETFARCRFHAPLHQLVEDDLVQRVLFFRRRHADGQAVAFQPFAVERLGHGEAGAEQRGTAVAVGQQGTGGDVGKVQHR